MIAGFHAPMPPARSGVADYAAALLPVLRKHGRVDVGASQADTHLYHLGNNRLHAGIYRKALETPGVVVLHDAVLQHLLLGLLTRDQYIDEFVYNYGVWSTDLAADLWANRGRSAADERYFQFPMLRRVLERSRAVIVHNPAAAAVARTHAPDAKIVEIPHPAIHWGSPLAADVTALRQELGLGARDFLPGVFGHLRASKRIETVADACEQAGLPLLIAGDCPREYERALAPVLSKPFVRRVPYAGAARFHLLAHSVDVCLNLRYPTAAETSGIGIGMMNIGKPVISTDGEELSRYPQDACIRVPHGPGERESVRWYLEWLNRWRCDALAIGRRAAEWIREHHDPDCVGELYWQVLRTC